MSGRYHIAANRCFRRQEGEGGRCPGYNSRPDDLSSTTGEQSGSAYIYARTDGGWELLQKLVAFDGEAGDNFGLSVAIDGGKLAVGAPKGGNAGVNTGAVYFY